MLYHLFQVSQVIQSLWITPLFKMELTAKADLVAYPPVNSQTSNNLNQTSFQQMLLTYDPSAEVSATEDLTGNQFTNSLTQIIIQFLFMEIIFLLLIVVFGIGIIMYISIHEKGHELGVLRARGLEKGIIYKMQLIEGEILILLGLIISLIGIVAADAIMIQFTSLSSYISGVTPQLIVPWLWLVLLLGSSLAAFIGIIVLAVKLELRNSDVSRIAVLLRMS